MRCLQGNASALRCGARQSCRFQNFLIYFLFCNRVLGVLISICNGALYWWCILLFCICGNIYIFTFCTSSPASSHQRRKIKLLKGKKMPSHYVTYIILEYNINKFSFDGTVFPFCAVFFLRYSRECYVFNNTTPLTRFKR